MNLPNMLSILRILLVPLFVLVFFSGSPHADTYAAIVFLSAGLTDILDGAIARRYNMVTRLGRVLDPLADKLMICTALFCAAISGLLPFWIPLIYLIKESVQIVGGLFFFRKMHDIPASNLIGKAATIVFYMAIVAQLMLPGLPVFVHFILFLCALILALTAFLTYYICALRAAAVRRERS